MKLIIPNTVHKAASLICSTDKCRQALQYYLVDQTDQKRGDANVVATDGRIMMIAHCDITGGSVSSEELTTGETLIPSWLPPAKGKGNVEIEIDGRKRTFATSFGTGIITIDEIEYPKWRQVVPVENPKPSAFGLSPLLMDRVCKAAGLLKIRNLEMNPGDNICILRGQGDDASVKFIFIPMKIGA